MAPRFKVLDDELERARLDLGIRDPVKVRITYYTSSPVDARYVGHRGGVHRIGVDGDASTKEASRAIWHELGHVRQAEELGGDKAFDREWGRQMRAAGISAKAIRAGKYRARKYRRVPLEAEAERVAKERKDWLLVAKR